MEFNQIIESIVHLGLKREGVSLSTSKGFINGFHCLRLIEFNVHVCLDCFNTESGRGTSTSKLSSSIGRSESCCDSEFDLIC